MPLRNPGLPTALVDAIDGALRPIIDAGYRPLPASTAVAPRNRRSKPHPTGSTRPAR